MPTKLDLRKELKPLLLPAAKKPEVVEVPEFNFLMLDGVVAAGTPVAEAPGFQEAVQALYAHLLHAQIRRQARQGPPRRLPGDGAGRAVVDRGRALVRPRRKVPWHYTL